MYPNLQQPAAAPAAAAPAAPAAAAPAAPPAAPPGLGFSSVGWPYARSAQWRPRVAGVPAGAAPEASYAGAASAAPAKKPEKKGKKGFGFMKGLEKGMQQVAHETEKALERSGVTSDKAADARFRAQFAFPPQEGLLHEYSVTVALSDTIMQGRLYVSYAYLCFHSQFQSEHVRVMIPLRDVSGIRKSCVIRSASASVPNIVDFNAHVAGLKPTDPKPLHDAMVCELFTTDGACYPFYSFASFEPAFAAIAAAHAAAPKAGQALTVPTRDIFAPPQPAGTAAAAAAPAQQPAATAPPPAAAGAPQQQPYQGQPAAYPAATAPPAAAAPYPAAGAPPPAQNPAYAAAPPPAGAAAAYPAAQPAPGGAYPVVAQATPYPSAPPQ